MVATAHRKTEVTPLNLAAELPRSTEQLQRHAVRGIVPPARVFGWFGGRQTLVAPLVANPLTATSQER